MNPNKPTRKEIENLKNLPTLPQILLKVIKFCNDHGKDFKELSQILEKDPSLTVKILRMVNSPYYGLRVGVKNILQAVTILGSNAIRNIAICTSVQGVFDHPLETSDFNLKAFWWHSLKCAVLARLIAENHSQVEPDEAFLSGLLHDIGRLVLWTNFGQQYSQILNTYRHNPQQCLEAEADLVADHCKIGEWLLKNWNFQPFMADAVLYHHESKDRISTALPLVQIVHMANAFSQTDSHGSGQTTEIGENIFGLKSAEVEKFISRADEETKTLAQSLGIEIEPPDETTATVSEIDTQAREDLTQTVKDISLMFGTLQNLLEAEDHETLLKTVHQGLQILFGVDNIIFFLREPDRKWLKGKTFAENKNLTAFNGLRIPMQIKGSLLNLCLKKREPLDSFKHSENEISMILDEQINRFLGREGMLCLPMCARGEDVGVIVIGLDKTEFLNLSKQAELMALYSGQAALALHVEHLKQSRFELLQSERVKAYSALSRKVVHEVNTPLSIIKNYISVMKRKISGDDPVQEELSFISEEIDRVAQTIHVFSKFSKFEDLIKGSLNINELVSNLTKVLIKSGLINPGIKLHLKLDHDLPVIQTDRNKLKQILINLLRNAVEAISKGGNIFIRTRYGKNRLDALTKQKSDIKLDYAEIMIKDDGPGIPDTIKSSLFDAHNTTKGPGHHGLGLSIVFTLVQELMGSITCESDSENGTCFRIVLPFV